MFKSLWRPSDSHFQTLENNPESDEIVNKTDTYRSLRLRVSKINVAKSNHILSMTAFKKQLTLSNCVEIVSELNASYIDEIRLRPFTTGVEIRNVSGSETLTWTEVNDANSTKCERFAATLSRARLHFFKIKGMFHDV